LKNVPEHGLGYRLASASLRGYGAYMGKNRTLRHFFNSPVRGDLSDGSERSELSDRSEASLPF